MARRDVAPLVAWVHDAEDLQFIRAGRRQPQFRVVARPALLSSEGRRRRRRTARGSLVFANLETTVPLVVRCGSPIGASVALWREPGCPVSRDALAIEVLAEWRVLRPASKHGYRGASAKGVVTSGAARRALRHSMNERLLSSPRPECCHPSDNAGEWISTWCVKRASNITCVKVRLVARLTHQVTPKRVVSWCACGLVVWGGAHLSIASSHVEDLV